MTDKFSNLDDLLEHFNQTTETFTYCDIVQQLRLLKKSLEENRLPVAETLNTEIIAFCLVPDYKNHDTGWGTYYGPWCVFNGHEFPSLQSITKDTINYWIARARSCSHPLLKVRYADIVWDLSAKVGANRCPQDITCIMIDASADAVNRSMTMHDIEAKRILNRALNVAISLNDGLRVAKISDAIINLEERIGADDKPGLWGFSFDLLIEGSKKVSPSESQTLKIISDLEARLTRLASVQELAKLNPHCVEDAALRLARYYRKTQQDADMRRVLNAYSDCYVKKTKVEQALIGLKWLKDVHSKLISFNLHPEAKLILAQISQVMPNVTKQMSSITVSAIVDQASFDDHLNQMSYGTWEEVFDRIVQAYLPIRSEMMQSLEIAASNSIQGLVNLSIFDANGRNVADIGPLKEDSEGQLIFHTWKYIQPGSVDLRLIVDKLTNTRQMSVEQISNFIYQSPFFDHGRRTIVETGLRAYLSCDWLVAIHLLVPQIEHILRRLVESKGGEISKTGRNGRANASKLRHFLGESSRDI